MRRALRISQPNGTAPERTMALEAPLRSSTGGILSSYSPLADMSVSSPDSASIQSQYIAQLVSYFCPSTNTGGRQGN